MFTTAGIDVGSNAIKTAIVSFNDDGRGETLVVTDAKKIRRRNTKDVVLKSFEDSLAAAGLARDRIRYVATTGEGEMVDFRDGHFYSMTAHARGAIFLERGASAVVDAGALHTKAFTIDPRSKVLAYQMTSQCASGSGQFLENISRYLGIPLEDVGALSLSADRPEMVSSICAVLAETDVINMVSRGIAPKNILKGIHLSMGGRVIALLRGLRASGRVMITGGLARDAGFVAALRELSEKDEMGLEFCTHELSAFAGALGAAIWGAFRHVKLQAQGFGREDRP